MDIWQKIKVKQKMQVLIDLAFGDFTPDVGLDMVAMRQSLLGLWQLRNSNFKNAKLQNCHDAIVVRS